MDIIFFLQSKIKKKKKSLWYFLICTINIPTKKAKKWWINSYKDKLLIFPKFSAPSNYHPLNAFTAQCPSKLLFILPGSGFESSSSYLWQSLLTFLLVLMYKYQASILWARSRAQNWGCNREEKNQWCPLGSWSPVCVFWTIFRWATKSCTCFHLNSTYWLLPLAGAWRLRV